MMDNEKLFVYFAGNCWEGAKSSNRRSRQEEVSGAIRFDRWPVLLLDSEAHSSPSWGCSILLCEQRYSANIGHHGFLVSGSTF